MFVRLAGSPRGEPVVVRPEFSRGAPITTDPQLRSAHRTISRQSDNRARNRACAASSIAGYPDDSELFGGARRSVCWTAGRGSRDQRNRRPGERRLPTAGGSPPVSTDRAKYLRTADGGRPDADAALLRRVARQAGLKRITFRAVRASRLPRCQTRLIAGLWSERCCIGCSGGAGRPGAAATRSTERRTTLGCAWTRPVTGSTSAAARA